MTLIDANFDFYTDTPPGKDPDSYSPTLRQYHKALWSKPLPSGDAFQLDDTMPKRLHHKSALGEFILSSDGIGVTFHDQKKMSHIVGALSTEESKEFFSICSTIGGYIVFPAKRVDNKMTINGARGCNHKIQDRFDLTLECIRRFYVKKESPLSDVLTRYSDFFNLFRDFAGYVDFFLLNDLVEEGSGRIQFMLPFDDFQRSSLPVNVSEYRCYRDAMTSFVKARGQRMAAFVDALDA